MKNCLWDCGWVFVARRNFGEIRSERKHSKQIPPLARSELLICTYAIYIERSALDCFCGNRMDKGRMHSIYGHLFSLFFDTQNENGSLVPPPVANPIGDVGM